MRISGDVSELSSSVRRKSQDRTDVCSIRVCCSRCNVNAAPVAIVIFEFIFFCLVFLVMCMDLQGIEKDFSEAPRNH